MKILMYCKYEHLKIKLLHNFCECIQENLNAIAI